MQRDIALDYNIIHRCLWDFALVAIGMIITHYLRAFISYKRQTVKHDIPSFISASILSLTRYPFMHARCLLVSQLVRTFEAL